MRSNARPSSLIIAIVVLALAALLGFLIPALSGGQPRGSEQPWTPPTPTISATVETSPSLPPPTLQAEARTPVPTPAATATRKPTATRAPTVMDSPTPLPASDTPRPAQAATVAPTETGVAELVTAGPDLGPSAEVASGPLNLRNRPGPEGAVLTMVNVGERFTIVGRTEDGAWLQVCCFDDSPGWLSASFVIVDGPLSEVPVVQ